MTTKKLQNFEKICRQILPQVFQPIDEDAFSTLGNALPVLCADAKDIIENITFSQNFKQNYHSILYLETIKKNKTKNRSDYHVKTYLKICGIKDSLVSSESSHEDHSQGAGYYIH